MGEFSRLIGVFLEPTKAFQDIVQRPKWLIPLLLVIASGLAFYVTYGSHVGWMRFMQHQVETNPKTAARFEQMPADQRASAMATAAKITGISFEAGIAVATPIIMLISAAIVLGMANAMGGGVRFKQVFSILCYGYLPMLLRFLLSIVVMFLKNPDDFNVTNPLAFNPAAFMDPVNSSKFWYTIGTSADLFVVWTLLLGATGLKAAAGKRLTFGGALFAAATPWLIFTLLGAAAAAAFS